MNKSAIIDGNYRYSLFRKWKEGPSVLFIMLNPSTADHLIDDPTIRRCISFAKSWDFGSLYVGNLYGYRATDPNVIMKMGVFEAVGEKNTHYLKSLISKCSQIVVAWGKQGRQGNFEMTQNLKDKSLWCLGICKDGSPKHPLYCKGNVKLLKWNYTKGEVK